MNAEEQARIYRKTSSRKFADHLFSFYIIFKEPINCNSHPPQSTLCFSISIPLQCRPTNEKYRADTCIEYTQENKTEME